MHYHSIAAGIVTEATARTTYQILTLCVGCQSALRQLTTGRGTSLRHDTHNRASSFRIHTANAHVYNFPKVGQSQRPAYNRPTGNDNNNYYYNNKCVNRTDTNPSFAFQIAFLRGTDVTGFLQGGSKSYIRCL